MFTNETEAYDWMLYQHLRAIVYRLRQLKEEHWDWTPNPATPTARTIATHAWQWLICDRQHIAEPDALLHADVPEPPSDPAAMCDAIEVETKLWRELFRGLTPEQLDSPRLQFNFDDGGDGLMNVRGFISHILQHVIYKSGQISMIFFALGYDGTEEYSAPFPNPIYAEIRAAQQERL